MKGWKVVSAEVGGKSMKLGFDRVKIVFHTCLPFPILDWLHSMAIWYFLLFSDPP